MDENLMPINEQDDSLLIAALISAEKLNLEEMGRALAEGPEMPVSEEFEARVRACFRAYEKTQTEEERRRKAETRKTQRRKFGRRLFTLVAVLTMLAWALYMTVGAFRTRVNNVVQNLTDEITSIRFFGETASSTGRLAYPGVIPDNFSCIKNEISANLDYARYENGEDYFIYKRQVMSNTESGDNIAVVGETLAITTVNGLPARVGITGGKEIVLAWHTDNFFYSITSTLSQEQITEMAESIPIE